YDDNVWLLEESSLPAETSTDSRLLEVFGLVSGRVGPRNAMRLDASAYVVRYADAPDFDQDAFRVGFAYLWDAGSWQLDAGSYYDYAVLAGSGFERRIGARLTAQYPLGETASMSFGYVHDDVGNVSADFRFVDGTRDRFSVGFEQRGQYGRLALGYARERNDRVGAHVSPSRHEIFAGYEHALTPDWSVEIQGLLRLSRYDRLAEPRDEDLSQLTVSATREFVSGWQLLGEYRIAENSSDADLFSYDRNRLVLSLNRLFGAGTPNDSAAWAGRGRAADTSRRACRLGRSRPLRLSWRSSTSRRRTNDPPALDDGIHQRLQGAAAAVDTRRAVRARRHRYVRRRAQARAVPVAEPVRPDAGDAGQRIHDCGLARVPRLHRPEIRSARHVAARRCGRRREGRGMDVEIRERDPSGAVAEACEDSPARSDQDAGRGDRRALRSHSRADRQAPRAARLARARASDSGGRLDLRPGIDAYAFGLRHGALARRHALARSSSRVT